MYWKKCGASCPWEVVRPDGPAQVAPIRGGLFALLPQLLGPRTHGPHKRPARASRVWGVWGAWARQLRKGAKSPPRAVPDFGCEPPIDQWWPGRGWKGGRVAGCWGRKVGRIFHLVPNPPTGIGAICAGPPGRTRFIGPSCGRRTSRRALSPRWLISETADFIWPRSPPLLCLGEGSSCCPLRGALWLLLAPTRGAWAAGCGGRRPWRCRRGFPCRCSLHGLHLHCRGRLGGRHSSSLLSMGCVGSVPLRGRRVRLGRCGGMFCAESREVGLRSGACRLVGLAVGAASVVAVLAAGVIGSCIRRFTGERPGQGRSQQRRPSAAVRLQVRYARE